MIIGIIIVFHNNEKQLEDDNFLKVCLKYQNIDLCLVNNASTDKTLQLLIDVKDEFQSHLEVLDIKKYTSITNAIRAGERYLTNSQNRKYIGYINLEDVNSAKALDRILAAFNSKTTKHNSINSMLNKPSKRQLIKNIFSVIDFVAHSNLVYPNSIK